jgi:uncharacterized SAM-dependent methyltransferase
METAVSHSSIKITVFGGAVVSEELLPPFSYLYYDDVGSMVFQNVCTIYQTTRRHITEYRNF